MNLSKTIISQQIKDNAKELGFLACGIAKAEKLIDEEKPLKEYLGNGFHGKMKYMENHFEKRLDPTLLEQGAKSVISLLYNYYTSEKQSDPEAPIISKYAQGKDYHLVVREKLNKLLQFIKTSFGEVNGRGFVDSAPVLERAWAKKAGLGWIGKNGNLLNQKLGSFFFISELIIDLELEYDEEMTQTHCGECTRCIDACPTQAIVAPGKVDGSKCISYLTIELKDEIPPEFKGKMQNRVFGCDICQDVCPFNKKRATKHNEKQFEPKPELLKMTKNDWYELSQEQFSYLFKDSAVKRTKYEGFVRNLKFLE
ncbi:MAG: tRNA epoxyqueuosine(34) reductase QueG [Chloroflexia bacterium]|nr:tRNA epoxyqueuosine(34) reductase QueG [Chloroflexia bacterium]